MVRIPEERIGVLIGRSGEEKRNIEKATHTTIEVDSKEGEVNIFAADGLQLFEAREIIRAIGRGFNPATAKELLRTDYSLEVIKIEDFGKSKNTVQRLKGRVIGSEGKSKRQIENLTNAHISIYGKTVAVISHVEDLPTTRLAIEKLLNGAKHATVYKMLERKRREKKMEAMKPFGASEEIENVE